jgi:hypothetical protein
MGSCMGICAPQQGKTINPIEIESAIKQSKQEVENKKVAENNEIHNNKENKEEEVDIDMDFMKQNESKIVKMQANMKRHMAQKQMEEKKKKEDNGN